MKLRKCLIFALFCALVFAACPGATAGPAETFFAVHCEPFTGLNVPKDPEDEDFKPHLWWNAWFYTLAELVEKADEDGHKLTIQLSPPWVRGILTDAMRGQYQKLDLVSSWWLNGHELAAHHHTVNHPGVWDGYTNLSRDRAEGIIEEEDDDDLPPGIDKEVWRGRMEDCRSLYTLLETALRDWIESTTGMEAEIEILTMSTDDPEADWTDGFPHCTRGLKIENAVSDGVGEEEYNGHDVFVLGHSSLAPLDAMKFDLLKGEYRQAGAGSIFGASARVCDYREGKKLEMIEEWFTFLAESGASAATVSRIIEAR